MVIKYDLQNANQCWILVNHPLERSFVSLYWLLSGIFDWMFPSCLINKIYLFIYWSESHCQWHLLSIPPLLEWVGVFIWIFHWTQRDKNNKRREKALTKQFVSLWSLVLWIELFWHWRFTLTKDLAQRYCKQATTFIHNSE